MVFAGNEQAAPRLLEAFTAAGFPAQVSVDRGGFDPEPLTVFIEVVSGEPTVAEAQRIAVAQGWQLRLHSPVEAQTAGVL